MYPGKRIATFPLMLFLFVGMLEQSTPIYQNTYYNTLLCILTESLSKRQKETDNKPQKKIQELLQWRACKSCYAITDRPVAYNNPTHTIASHYKTQHTKYPRWLEQTRWLWPCSSFLCLPPSFHLSIRPSISFHASSPSPVQLHCLQKHFTSVQEGGR